jgi:hypothetical protein
MDYLRSDDEGTFDFHAPEDSWVSRYPRTDRMHLWPICVQKQRWLPAIRIDCV